MNTKKNVKNIMVALLLVFLITPNVKVKAANKYFSKKTITTTVNYDMKDTNNKRIFIKAKNKKTLIKISVKIVKMTGKAQYEPHTSQAEYKMLSLFDMYCREGIGATNIPKKKFKKGATIKIEDFGGSGYFELDKPYGVKSVTYKLTFKTKNNKKEIKSVSIKDI